MKVLVILAAMLLAGCDQVGSVRTLNDGTCEFGYLKNSTVTRTVDGTTVTCSIIFEKTK